MPRIIIHWLILTKLKINKAIIAHTNRLFWLWKKSNYLFYVGLHRKEENRPEVSIKKNIFSWLGIDLICQSLCLTLFSYMHVSYIFSVRFFKAHFTYCNRKMGVYIVNLLLSLVSTLDAFAIQKSLVIGTF